MISNSSRIEPETLWSQAPFVAFKAIQHLCFNLTEFSSSCVVAVLKGTAGSADTAAAAALSIEFLSNVENQEKTLTNL